MRAGLRQIEPDTLPPLFALRTPRLLLRPWRQHDAEPLSRLIATNLLHLQRWLPWAVQEPEPVEKKRERLAAFRSKFTQRLDLIFGMFDSAQSDSNTQDAILGSIGLHMRIGFGAAEIGYWVRQDRTRNSFATEAAAALTRFGFEKLNLQRVEVHCDPANIASAGVPQKLGFTKQSVIRNRVLTSDSAQRDTEIWSLTYDRLASSQAVNIQYSIAHQGIGDG